ncbi:hypothetical protein JCM8097_004920 [Rhodosporidiobolus ruineniae]
MTTPPSRRPRFTLNDDEDDDSEREHDEPSSPPAVPAIVVEDVPPRRDPGEEERHVGFGGASVAPTPIVEVPDVHVEGEKREEELQANGNGKETYPPSSKEEKSKKKEGFEAANLDEKDPSEKKTWTDRVPFLPGAIAWADPHLNWKGLRPVVRSSVAAWCGLVLMLCGPSERMLGQASFLVLVVATICPAALPIASQLEQTFFQCLLVACSWAWGCIALAIAHAARSKYKFTQAEFTSYAAERFANAGSAAEITSAIQLSIFHGDYLEPASSVVCAIFLGAATGFLLWLRGYLGPGPALFGVIFSIILQCIMLTTGVLFPYAYYSIGLIFFRPFICQIAINLACTFLIFPETLAHQFSDRLIAALQPLKTVIHDQDDMLKANPRTEEWLKFKTLRAGTNAAIGGVGLLAMSESNLTREISFARVNGRDLSKILQHMRILATRSTGFPHFYEVVEKHLHRDESDAKGGVTADDLVVHLGRSRPASPSHSIASSRAASPTRERRDSGQTADPEALNKALSKVQHSGDHDGHHSPSGSVTFSPSPLSPSPRPSVSHQPSHSHLRHGGHSSSSLADLAENPSHDRPSSHRHHSHSHHHSSRRRSRSRQRHHKHSSSHMSIPSLLHDVLHPQLDIKPVGVLQSATYADLEDYLHNPADEQHLEQIIRLLSKSSSDLIHVCEESVGHLIDKIHRFKSLEDTWASIFRYDDKAVEEILAKSKKQLAALKTAHETYRDAKRLDVIRPFSKLFDPFGSESLRVEGGSDGSSHEEELQTPSHRGLFWAFAYQHSLIGWSEALIDLFETVVKLEEKRRRPRVWFPDWKRFQFSRTGGEENDYGDQDPEALRELNTQAFSAPRHPDYRPPKTLIQVLGVKLYNFSELITRRDVLFGVKAGILIGLCSMPAYFKTTSYFFYHERGIWVLIMICLTTNQFVGDVLFGFIVRVWGTFLGAAVGLLVWSIAAQTGKGNPFAVAATCAVAYPLIFFYRVHMMPPMTAILPAVTAQLVIGYSWQDAHNPALSSVGWGWDVAWKRFVCVMIGISIAFLAAFLPPATRQKVTIRRTYAKVINRMGDVVAQILSFALTKDGPVKPPHVIVRNLAALRQRVNKTVQARAMARYELSLQGEWPAELYASLQTLQMEMLDMLGQLAGVISKLDQRWTRALLHRTQLANPRFLQDLMSTLQLVSSALDHGTPLPFVYNPLLERFLKSPEAVAAGHAYGYDVVLGDDEIEGLPQHVDLKTICSLDYLRFSSGVSQAYAIVNRLDRLMFVAKSLVGESYLVYGYLDASERHHHHHPYRPLADRDDLDSHFHGPASRRTSFERSDSIV